MLRIVISFILILFFSACQTVEPYQRVYLNDQDMKVQPREAAFNEINAANYREGAAGAVGGKSGGGCGCN